MAIAAQTFDPAILDQLVVALDRNTVGELIRLFQREATTSCQDLAAALSNGDRDRLQREAHTLKGAAANIGAFAVLAAAEVLEDACRAVGTAELAPGVAHIEKSVGEAIDALREYALRSGIDTA